MEAQLNLIKIRAQATLAVLLITATYGCAHSQPTPPKEVFGPFENPVTMGPTESYGPPVEEASPAYGPEPIQIHPVVLVFGPGIARDFAASGVLHALHDNNIPIAAIVATEFGSLVGGLYALDGNLNHFDWALMRFKDNVFVESGMFSKILRQDDSEKLDTELARAFGSKDLTQTKLPFRVVIQLKAANQAIIADRGRISQAVRAAIAVPQLYAPGRWDGADAVAAGDTLPFPVAEAKAMNLGPVVVINTLDKKDSAKSENELKDADLVLEPDMTGIGYMDFQRRSEAAFRGKTVVGQHVVELRRLVGLPELEGP